MLSRLAVLLQTLRRDFERSVQEPQRASVGKIGHVQLPVGQSGMAGSAVASLRNPCSRVVNRSSDVTVDVNINVTRTVQSSDTHMYCHG